MRTLIRSVILGLAVGGRASLGLTAPALVGTRGRTGAGATALRTVGVLALLGELVGDKLPATPSRLEGGALAGRVVSGGAGALALALLRGSSRPAAAGAALAGAAAAFAGSHAGFRWRAWAAQHGPDVLRPDLRAALIEDALVLTALTTTTRP